MSSSGPPFPPADDAVEERSILALEAVEGYSRTACFSQRKILLAVDALVDEKSPEIAGALRDIKDALSDIGSAIREGNNSGPGLSWGSDPAPPPTWGNNPAPPPRDSRWEDSCRAAKRPKSIAFMMPHLLLDQS